VRATFRNTEKYDVDDAPAYFEDVAIELSVVSSAPSAAVRKLVTHAERACHAAQSLSHAVPVRLHATLNQEPLA
jgi:organic hydroperoxide reductase OsmC/OhrA